MIEAAIPISSVKFPASSEQHTAYNDDHRVGSSRPIRYKWEGEQGKRIAMRIDEASPIEDHIRNRKAVVAGYFITKEIPLRQEATGSIRVVPDSIRALRELQLGRARGVFNDAADIPGKLE